MTGLPGSIHSNLTPTLGRVCSCYPHLTDEDSEVQGGPKTRVRGGTQASWCRSRACLGPTASTKMTGETGEGHGWGGAAGEAVLLLVKGPGRSGVETPWPAGPPPRKGPVPACRVPSRRPLLDTATGAGPQVGPGTGGARAAVW